MKNDKINAKTCLRRLKERFYFSYDEIRHLNSIEKFTIISVAFTENGGFDRDTGEFHEEDTELNFKIRIKYFLKDLEIEKIMVLGANQEISANLLVTRIPFTRVEDKKRYVVFGILNL